MMNSNSGAIKYDEYSINETLNPRSSRCVQLIYHSLEGGSSILEERTKSFIGWMHTLHGQTKWSICIQISRTSWTFNIIICLHVIFTRPTEEKVFHWRWFWGLLTLMTLMISGWGKMTTITTIIPRHYTWCNMPWVPTIHSLPTKTRGGTVSPSHCRTLPAARPADVHL